MLPPPPPTRHTRHGVRYCVLTHRADTASLLSYLHTYVPCQGAPIDPARFPANHENRRGMVDVYGQLSADYATQRGDQMAPIGRFG